MAEASRGGDNRFLEAEEKPVMKQFCQFLIFAFTVNLPILWAEDYQLAEVKALIAANVEPDGVVFELMTWEDDSWDWAAPMLQNATRQLREKYPGIDIALISHGNELFDLALQENNQSQPSIQTLQNLSNEEVDIHICGTFASYKHLGTKDFLPFVDVSPSGPAQLNDYIRLGFTHIVLEQASAAD